MRCGPLRLSRARIGIGKRSRRCLARAIPHVPNIFVLYRNFYKRTQVNFSQNYNASRKRFHGPARKPPWEFLMAVGELDLGQEKVPTIAIALLETCLMSPKIVDGFYRTIPPSKAKMLKSKTTRKAVLRGEQVLEDARRLARKLGVLERPEAAGLLGW